MSIAVIGWQLIVFFTIVISGKNRALVVSFWLVWTILQVFSFPLSVLQFLTILLAVKLSNSKQPPSVDYVFTGKRSIPFKPNDAKGDVVNISTPIHPSVVDSGAPQEWSLELLNALDWKRFEDLCSAYFSERGVKSKQTSLGADGGIDILLYENNLPNPTALVQCKRWSEVVGVKLVREFVGVMHHEKIHRGYFITTSQFNRAATDFAKANNLKLVDGKTMLDMISALPKEAQNRLLLLATSGDYTTPTCVRCGTKMVLRNAGKAKPFWGCKSYPKCRVMIKIKS